MRLGTIGWRSRGVGPRRLGMVSGSRSPLTVASLAHFYDSAMAYVSQDDAGATPVTAAGDVVGRVLDRSSAAKHRTQATGSLKPLWQAAGLDPDGSDDELAGTAVTVGSSTAFTAYAGGTRAAGEIWTPLGTHAAAATDDAVEVSSDNKLYYIVAGNVGGVTAGTVAAGSLCVRVRRDAANNLYLKATGYAEENVGAVTGGVALTAVGRRKSAGHFTATAARHRFGMVFSADLVATGEAAGVEAFIAANYGVGF